MYFNFRIGFYSISPESLFSSITGVIQDFISLCTLHWRLTTNWVAEFPLNELLAHVCVCESTWICFVRPQRTDCKLQNIRNKYETNKTSKREISHRTPKVQISPKKKIIIKYTNIHSHKIIRKTNISTVCKGKIDGKREKKNKWTSFPKRQMKNIRCVAKNKSLISWCGKYFFEFSTFCWHP